MSLAGIDYAIRDIHIWYLEKHFPWSVFHYEWRIVDQQFEAGLWSLVKVKDQRANVLVGDGDTAAATAVEDEFRI